MKELVAGDAVISFNEDDLTLRLKGSLRLPNMNEYEPIGQLMRESAVIAGDALTLDLKGLTYLNSSGITNLSLFVLHCKKNHTPQITILGDQSVSWQEKSLSNFKKLWDQVKIVIE